MLILNQHPDHNKPLDISDAQTLGAEAAKEVERFLSHRDNHVPTPLHALPGLAAELGIAALHVKDEGQRLGLGSFKALGGSYAVIRLVLEEANRQLGRIVDVSELHTQEVRAIASRMTFGCATDGNHGKSVAAGARLVGAKSAIFVHAGVSDERVAAIARYGAEMIRVDGTYDDSIRESARVSEAKGWTVVSDTSWPGYERIPGLVMQGYTAIICEALRDLPELPTHVFVQAGVGGVAAALAGHLALVFGDRRPTFIVVEPARAACIFASAAAGEVVKIAHGEATVMAMLECYEPSPVAWRVLTRAADAFMTVEEEGAVRAMNRLARPLGNDTPVVAGESGGAGLAGLFAVAGDQAVREAIHLDSHSRVFIVNTEGATDPELYTRLVGLTPHAVIGEDA
ncbi:diaminopropionate ammonia-lyase [Phyllobacterium sp. P30BS-XVII]|uniref:diaminopropionate ammonia-lyase n=1 Tax=Phyllobacterium sp. P30BS-XVII TaxID=2587046 RepID=UPI0015F805E6|nr:diaminopropionate ammonia-lyase [Phyllobacterium sp. P30BS-XVII]MBA8899193.1 diaminopropionate ammonia-lyase [Phyllobacterium sp. P30BS-XVII]